MHTVYCNLCGQDNTREFAVIEGTRIVRCRNCGLVYVNPREDRDLVSSHEDYYGDGSFLREPSHWNIGSRDSFAEKLSIIRRYQRSGSLLDVGCGGGFFLDVARQQGYNPYGVELDKDACEFAAEHLCLQVFHGTLSGAAFQDGFFDVVTVLNVLEHVDSPIELLREIVRVLKPGGLVVIDVPNLVFGLAVLKFRNIASKFHNVGALDRHIKRISVFTVPEHLYLFTPWTIRALLTKAGLDCMAIANASVVTNPGSPVWTAAKRLVCIGSKAISGVSYGKLTVGYSMTVVASRPRPSRV